jgi:DNA-binding NarL/FixJ family response regulator
MQKTTIVIADDHDMIRTGLRAILEGEDDLEVVGEAADGVEALEVVRKLHPDLLLLDISMPKLNGARLLERLREAEPRPRVLVLTAFEDAVYLRQMLGAGAEGYLLKRSAARELIRAIRAVAGGNAYLDAALTKLVVASFVDPRARPEARASAELSARESQVMRLVARGYTNKEIAERLGLSVKTVETHKTKLMAKLGLRTRAEVVQHALRLGLLDDDTPR